MQNNSINSTLFVVILLIFLLNTIISSVNVIEDGFLLRRIIPAVCWYIATIILITTFFRKTKDKIQK